MKRFLFPVFFALLGVAIALPYSGDAATYRPPSSSIANDSITSAKITNGTIVDADVSSSAAIDIDKISFQQQTTVWPSSQGVANSVITNNGAGTLSWAKPQSLVVPYFASSTGAAMVAAVPVVAGDIVLFSGTADRATCSANNVVNADLNYKQSTYAATTTVMSAEDSAEAAVDNCNVALEGVFIATTTETVNFQTGLNVGNHSTLTVVKYR